MTKTTSAAFDAHIQGEATTLSFLWRATRRDGAQFFFTNHDRDIPINVDDVADTDNADTYKASTGFTATSIMNTSNLSVDNMDIESLLDDEGLLEQDMRGGKWDFAQIEVYMVNWADTSMGTMQLRRGYLGEVSIRDEVYNAELRGLVQLLQQVIGEVYTPNCRADLGDARCKFDLSLVTETLEVEAIDATNRIITAPANFTGRTEFEESPDFFFSIGVKVDDGDDPPLGKLTLLRRATVEDGTFRNPYIVATIADVNDMRDDPLAWYAMANNVDMAAHGLFTPIGTQSEPWMGGLDGRGFQIQNLNLDHSAAPLGLPVGLFGFVSNANILRLGMLNPNVNGGESTQYKSAMVGELDDGSTMEDCYVEDTGAGNIETSGDRAGGLIGITNRTFGAGVTLRRNWAAISITGSIGIRVGGLMAFDNGPDNIISLNKQDTTVGITDLGTNVTAIEVQALSTTDMQLRANYAEPTGATVELKTASLPNRAGAFFDFFTVWLPPVAATDYARHRTWY